MHIGLGTCICNYAPQSDNYGEVAMVTDLEKADRINVPSHLRAVDLCCNTAL